MYKKARTVVFLLMSTGRQAGHQQQIVVISGIQKVKSISSLPSTSNPKSAPVVCTYKCENMLVVVSVSALFICVLQGLVAWLWLSESGAGGGGGSDADDAGDNQLLSQQLTTSQPKPHLHSALSEISLHAAAGSQHVPRHCRQHRPREHWLVVPPSWRLFFQQR